MTFVVGWAFEHGHYPSEVVAHFKENPRDKLLLESYAIYAAMRQAREMEQQKKNAEKQAKKPR